MSRHDPSPHPSDGEIERFRRGLLTAAELIAFGDHLASCGDCRARAAAPAVLVSAGRRLDAALDLAGGHVREEDVHAYVDGTLDAARRGEVEEHIEHCPSCESEIADLQQFAALPAAARRGRASWWYGGVAAAAALLLGMLVFGRTRPTPVTLLVLNDGAARIGVDALGNVDGASALAPDDLSRLRQAMVAGRLTVPASALAGTGGSLRGPGDAAAFSVIAPVGTAVLSDRPALTWTPLAPDATYIVRLREEATGTTVVSPPLRAGEWKPDIPLARGATYVWQVEGSAGGRDVTAPAPPAPAARFSVVGAADAARLTRAPASHLVRGVLYANAGLLDESERELKALRDQNPESELVRRFIDQLAQARRR